MSQRSTMEFENENNILTSTILLDYNRYNFTFHVQCIAGYQPPYVTETLCQL